MRPYSLTFLATLLLCAGSLPLLAQDGLGTELSGVAPGFKRSDGKGQLPKTAYSDFKGYGGYVQGAGQPWGDHKNEAGIWLYGSIWFSAAFDDSRVNDPTNFFWVRSEDTTQAFNAAVSAPGKGRASMQLSSRLARFGLMAQSGSIEEFFNFQIGGTVEFDFANTFLASNVAGVRFATRLRLAFLWLRKDDFIISAGQREDVIAPWVPMINDEFQNWGVGNLGDWRPQFRVEFLPVLGDVGRLILQAMAGATGTSDVQDLDVGGNPLLDGEASGAPTLQVRLGYRFNLTSDGNDWLEVALWYHRAWERPDTSAIARKEFASYAIGADLKLNLFNGVVQAAAEYWYGQNLDDVRGGILQGVNQAAIHPEVRAIGGWFEVRVKPVEWLQFGAGYTFDDPRNSDIAGAASQRKLNKAIYVGVRYLWLPLEVSFNYQFWRTDFLTFSKGDDNRFYFALTYHFTTG